MKHYSAAELDQYRHDDMSSLKKILCAAHLKICKECQQKLDALQSDDELLQE